MKRTISPQGRKRILHEHITLNIIPGAGDAETLAKAQLCSVNVQISLQAIQADGCYPSNSEIKLEAYNRTNIAIVPLGKIKDYTDEEKSYPLPFANALRPKINFRIKIIDPESYKLLGYAENLKEQRYTDSLLGLSTEDDSVTNIFKIDFENLEYPILYLNPRLKPYAETLKLIIAEMALKEILVHLLIIEPDNSDTENNQWISDASKLVPLPSERNTDNLLDWIQEVLCKFSEKHKIVKEITQKLTHAD